MRFCHACQQELDASSLAAGRCGSCGAAIRRSPSARSTTSMLLRKPQDRRTATRRRKNRSTSPSARRSRTATMDDLARGYDSILAGQNPTCRQLRQTTSAAPPAGKASDPERKSPTVADRADMTMEFQAIRGPRHERSEADRGARPTRIESDKTIDLLDVAGRSRAAATRNGAARSIPAASKARRSASGKRSRGFRSSLPVKSRYVREKRKGPAARRRSRWPKCPTTSCSTSSAKAAWASSTRPISRRSPAPSP